MSSKHTKIYLTCENMLDSMSLKLGYAEKKTAGGEPGRFGM